MSGFNLYLDESGTANINDYYDTFFVIGGVIIEDQYDHDLTNYFTFLKERYGIKESVNFHASEFFETRKNSLFNGISNEEAIAFCFSLGEFIKTIPLKILAYSVFKSEVRTLLKIPEEYSLIQKKVNIEDIDIAYEVIVRKMIFEFTSHLLLSDSLGSVIAESRKESDHVLLRAYTQSQEPFRFKIKPYYSNFSDEARKRISSIRFENKRGLSGGLEIADICSYIVYRHLHNTLELESSQHRGLLNLWKVIEPKIEKPLHSRHGLLLTKKDMVRAAHDRVYKVSDHVLSRIRSETLQTLP